MRLYSRISDAKIPGRMRRLLILAVLATLGGLAIAQPQRKGMKDYADSAPPSTPATKRAVTGKPDVEDYGAKKKAPERPFPWRMLGLGVLVALACIPLAVKAFANTTRELDAHKTFGRGASGEKIEGEAAEAEVSASRRPAARAPGAPRSARDLVLSAMQRSQRNWVTADWVAKTSGLSPEVATRQLGALTEEGTVREARDQAGSPVYRTT